MSYDKKTINMSQLDAIKNVLDDLSVPYSWTKLANVDGAGANDYLPPGLKYKMMVYSLRRLVFKNTVILERITRTTDCDTDDIITSHQFNLEDEPKDWKCFEEIDNA